MASRIVQYFADKLKSMKEYPITLTKAVYDENGKRLDNKLQEIDNSISDINSNLSQKANVKIINATLKFDNKNNISINNFARDYSIDKAKIIGFHCIVTSNNIGIDTYYWHNADELELRDLYGTVRTTSETFRISVLLSD